MKFEPGPEDVGVRLDIFLSGRLSEWTRSQLQLLNRQGDVLVDNVSQKDGYRLRGREVIAVELPDAQDTGGDDPDGIIAESIPLTVHYEDALFAVVEKPAGMVVHPGAGNRTGTLVNALRSRFPLLSNAGGVGRPGIVHRLDRWTSGLILVAKTNAAHAQLSKSFQDRQVKKIYVGAVHGKMSKSSGEIDLTIGRHPTKRTRMAAGGVRGREAHSEYQVRETIAGFSLLDVSIQTGRTHQIRVHLAAIGHPVIGDTVYGEKLHRAFEHRHGSFDRYFLHAEKLAFPHPGTSEWLELVSPMPDELARKWAELSGRK
jgi:23S rRNA pseudouridine1911/1915/1917 synthase